MISKGILRARLALALTLAVLAGPAFAQGNYTLFESGPVRPLALSADGTKLFVCNIPDGRLEIFNVTAAGLAHSGSVQVGVDPVAVAVAPNGQVWVVNHMSDSISIVDVPTLRVVRTLLVGDEPRDIVFAGVGNTRAFITTARRGQARPQVDPNAPDEATTDLLTPGLGRADVWVFESTALGTSLSGDELAIVTLFGDTPRALAKSLDGLTVYAAVFQSGNKTTAVTEGVLPTPGPLPNAPAPVPQPPLPATQGPLAAPQVGVMLQQVGPTTWRDVDGVDHTNLVRFTLPDYDVFAIDADASAASLGDGTAVTAEIAGVGTVLFNMVVNPANGTVYVSNTDANNMDRFEGSGPTTLRGELHRAQISLISGGVAQQRRLNPHIVYTNLNPPAWMNDLSLAIPTDMAISADGSTLYVAAFGSRKIGIINTPSLALAPGSPGAYDPNNPATSAHVELSAGGPGGVVLDETNDRLYVLTRFDNAISIVDTNTETETAHIPVHSPELPSITNGRRFLYDSRFSSSNGESSCASCHVFGDFDSLAWDLGDPAGSWAPNNNPFVRLNPPGQAFALVGPVLNALAPGSVVPGNVDFHPLKGPMTTQTLRGMDHGGPMHWRGDRSGGTAQNSPGYDGTPGALDETLAFQAFNPAFVGLLGRQAQISAGDMIAFTNFILQVQLPPNPIRALDRSLTTEQQAGLTFYNGPISDTLKNCNGCHTLDATQGFFGTGGRSTFEGETQHFKVAHLRNAYQKVGMFGQAGLVGTGNPTDPQVRGFGYLHDGSVATVMNFLGSGSGTSVFQFPGGDPQRMQVTRLTMAFDTDLAPAVGQQVTLTADNDAQPDVTARLAELITRAGTNYPDPDRPVNKDCDLVVKGRINGQPRGWWMSSSAPAMFTPDVNNALPESDATVRALVNVAGQELTYTCVPPGSGTRLGIDRGGVGEGSQPDNIRDASQCGDVTEDGVATGIDVTGMRRWLAGAGTPEALEKCNVNGANGNAPANCDVADVAALRRGIALLGPPLTQGCVL
jgi:YVTN family beta-propeller protein